MNLRNGPDRWGAISQLLHWVVALLIIAVAIIGLTMDELPRGLRKIEVYALHKSLGLTVLALVALRLAWRLHAGTPRDIPDTPRWQSRVAHFTHVLLYVLMFTLPLSGWLLNSAAGYPLQWFGQFNLPPLSMRSEDLRDLAEDVHEAGFYVLLALVAAHIAAAFHHHLFRRDAVLSRMLPWRPRSEVSHD